MTRLRSIVFFVLLLQNTVQWASSFSCPGFTPFIPKLSTNSRNRKSRFRLHFVDGVAHGVYLHPPPLTIDAEEGVLGSFAHFSLDISTLILRNSLVIRVFVFFGRLSVMAYDYLPDNHIEAPEFLFQLSMLTLSTYFLLLSLRPFLASSPNFSILRLYQSSFRSTGIPLRDFNFLCHHAGKVQKFPSGTTLLHDGQDLDALYFLINGSVDFIKAGRVVGTMGSRCDTNLVGEVSFQSRLHNSKGRSGAVTATVVAGEAGASVFAFEGEKLRRIMRQNDEINKAINSILANNLHLKLRCVLENQ